MRYRLWEFFTCLSIACLTATATAEETRHSFFIAGPTFTGIIDEEGRESWNADKPAAREGWVLPNGNALIAWSDEVRELTRDKRQTFRYDKSLENREIGCVERLADGNTLVSELGAKPRLLLLDLNGKVLQETPLLPETDNAHMQTRMARRLPNGNYLVPHLLAFQIKEYTPAGAVVKVLRTDLPELGGRAAENWPFTAIRLENGNTLAALTHGNKVAEFDPAGAVAWQVSNDDLPGRPISDACGCQRLPNGNTVIASYAARQGVKIVEVDRDKRIVWTYSGPQRAHHIQLLTTNGTPIPGKPLR